ncbi:hypothetical protein LX15_004270 [Streptoalloteichus tenebrarius]|uniref:Uncharacterized protein n=1 Tax=Streptoalloteichus tenebrarius (strain ATCC 17920 / DSM 40477 / JCM 4838 / CBS 697.72 / NBRC 16177 / NCIMB 11028 / NRRL B-12390 / A12253. 1 / ISP 5477) TaxID=1933 RepID=A0ABT1HYF4_STRSD|nr:SHOCT domain-containing protein [Streptoalloteichus tenebrarius]MCP2260552.1 hypothetical protein [Streptoalloteichus tenebrarius]BFF01892.1 hypothetical protein GCM10020241_35670 [Streptoalloteichus tenebrarius]
MTWQDELRRLDEELAAGRISADEYRQRRDQMASAGSGSPGTPPGGQPLPGGGAPAPQGAGPFPPPFRWGDNADTTQVVGQGSDQAASSAESTQVVRSGGDADRTQVVPGGVGASPPPPGYAAPGYPPQAGAHQPMPVPGGWAPQAEPDAPPWAGSDLPSLAQGWLRQGPEVFDEDTGSSTGKKIGIVAAVVVLVGALSFGAYWLWGRDTASGKDQPAATGETSASPKPKDPMAVADLGGKAADHSRITTFDDVKKINYLTPEEIQIYEAGRPDKARMAVAQLGDGQQAVVLNVAVGEPTKAADTANSLSNLQRVYGMEAAADMPSAVKVTKTGPKANTPATVRGHYRAKGVVVRVQVTGKDLDAALSTFRKTLDRQLEALPADE